MSETTDEQQGLVLKRYKGIAQPPDPEDPDYDAKQAAWDMAQQIGQNTVAMGGNIASNGPVYIDPEVVRSLAEANAQRVADTKDDWEVHPPTGPEVPEFHQAPPPPIGTSPTSLDGGPTGWILGVGTADNPSTSVTPAQPAAPVENPNPQK